MTQYSDEMIRSIARGVQNALEQYERELAVLREAIASRLESTPEIHFKHKVDGRLHDSELRAVFSISTSAYSDDVRGPVAQAVFEFMHREGYDRQVETRLLPRPRTVLVVDDNNTAGDDSIPF